MNTWRKIKTLWRQQFRQGYAHEKDSVATPAGEEVVYDVIRRDPFPVAIAVLPDNKILFVKEHKYPTNRITIGLPMGGSDGQDLKVAARRELEEETGYTSDDFEYLGEFQEAAGFCDAIAHIFFTKDVRKATNPAHDPLDDDAIDVLAFTYNEVEQMVADGTIDDGPTLAALYRAEKQGKFSQL